MERSAGATHHHVQALYGKKLVGAVHGGLGFKLHHRQRVAVLVSDDFRKARGFIAHHGAVDTVTALAQGRETHPAEGFAQNRRIFHAREDDALGARIEQPRRQRIEQLADADDGGDIGIERGLDHVLHGFQVERAVLHVEKDIIEAGGGKGAGDFRRAVALQPASEYGLAAQHLLPRLIGLHVGV